MITHGNYILFLIIPWKFHLLFLQCPCKFHIPYFYLNRVLKDPHTTVTTRLHESYRNYSILAKLSWELATLTWKLMAILYSERQPFTLPGEVWLLPKGSEDNLFYLWCILSASLRHCVINYTMSWRHTQNTSQIKKIYLPNPYDLYRRVRR